MLMKPIRVLLLFAVTMLATSACGHDDLPPNEDTGGQKVAPNVVVLAYDTYTKPDDVRIVSADTSQIEVSQTYLNAQGKLVCAGSILSIWRTMSTRPFVRKVTDVRQQGEVVRVTSEPADIGDLFSDADAKLSSTLYVEPNRVGDPCQRYFNADAGTVHPAVIIVEDEGTSDRFSETPSTDTGSLPKAYTAEQLLANPPSNGRWRIIDKKVTATMMLSAGDAFAFGVNEAKVHAYADLVINFKVKWFKLKKFEFIVNGGLDADVPVVLRAQAQQKFSKEVTLAQLPTYTMVFWLGPVPVGITLDPSVQLDLEASVSAKAQFTIPFEAHANLSLGPCYDEGWGFRKDFTLNAGARLSDMQFSGQLKADASAGICLKVGSYLYTLAGPYVKMGPWVETENAVTADMSAGKLKLHTKGSFKLGSRVGAEIKVWKWALAGFEYQLPSFCEKQLWDYEKVM